MAVGSLSHIQASHIDGRAQTTRFIQKELRSLHHVLLENAQLVQGAIVDEGGITLEEARIEYSLALAAVRNHFSSIDLQHMLGDEYSIAKGSDFSSRRIATKIAYIVPSMHTLFYSVISALSAAIAAGSCVVLELPNTTSGLNGFLKSNLPKSLDVETFAIVKERVKDSAFMSLCIEVGDAHSEGSPSAKHSLLSPATRVVAMVDRTADITKAAEALVKARFAFGGHSPYAPDLVLVNEFVFDDFARVAAQETARYSTNGVADKREAPKALTPEELRGAQARVIISGSKGSVVKLENRKSPLFWKKSSNPVLFLHPIRSLDHAIDLTNEEESLIATYVFAAPEEAKYIGQYFNANAAFVNHIPAELLVGNAAPSEYPIDVASRYTKEMFTTPRPQYISTGLQAKGLIDLQSISSSSQSKDLLDKTTVPLPATDQPAGGSIGFFEQGILTGLGVLSVPIIGGFVTLAYIGGRAVIRRL